MFSHLEMAPVKNAMNPLLTVEKIETPPFNTFVPGVPKKTQQIQKILTQAVSNKTFDNYFFLEIHNN